MFKASDFCECYVIELNWVGDMKTATVRVKITHKSINKKYLKHLKELNVCIIYDKKTGFLYTYPAKDIKGERKEYMRFIYSEKFVDAYRVINHYKTCAGRLISMVGYSKQNAELGFDNLTDVDFGNEKINIDEFLN